MHQRSFLLSHQCIIKTADENRQIKSATLLQPIFAYDETQL